MHGGSAGYAHAAEGPERKSKAEACDREIEMDSGENGFATAADGRVASMNEDNLQFL